jgi:hypothetical protein
LLSEPLKKSWSESKPIITTKEDQKFGILILPKMRILPLYQKLSDDEGEMCLKVPELQ